MTKGRKPPARRNPIALRIRTLGQKVKPSGKIYQRQEKYRNRRRKDGGFDVLESWFLGAVRWLEVSARRQ